MAMRRREDRVFPNAAGIDIGATSHWVAIPSARAEQPVREFGVMTNDLNDMARWLIDHGVDTVALESRCWRVIAGVSRPAKPRLHAR